MFAIGLICFLAGGVCAALYVNHYAKEREVAAYYAGQESQISAQAEKNSLRAQKAAKTRKERKS